MICTCTKTIKGRSSVGTDRTTKLMQEDLEGCWIKFGVLIRGSIWGQSWLRLKKTKKQAQALKMFGDIWQVSPKNVACWLITLLNCPLLFSDIPILAATFCSNFFFLFCTSDGTFFGRHSQSHIYHNHSLISDFEFLHHCTWLVF